MADGRDKESKTEAATEKKVSDAVEKGNVPRSREISVFASLLGILTAAAFVIGPRVSDLATNLMIIVDHPGGFVMNSGDEALQLLWSVSLLMGGFLVPIVTVLAVSGFAAGFLQNTPGFHLEHIKPKWSRISPAEGWGRIFGTRGMVEFGKALLKFGAIALVCLMIINGDRARILDAVFLDPMALPGLVLSLVMRIVAAVCVGIVLLVVGDILWSRFRWRTDLRMTRQEVKDEMKQSEGDPLVKSRLRSLARDRARRRMIASVPRATVVIANPTHYAVALRYERAKGGAPVVVAKGIDLVALRIREIASAHGVPVVEDKPLARALFDAVEVDQWIPPEFYRAVAKVLYILYARPAHAGAR